MTTKTATLHVEPATEITLTHKPLDWQKSGLQYTASGYGSRIPTEWVTMYVSKLRRVYCTVYSNNGTCWITVKGKKITVS